MAVDATRHFMDWARQGAPMPEALARELSTPAHAREGLGAIEYLATRGSGPAEVVSCATRWAEAIERHGLSLPAARGAVSWRSLPQRCVEAWCAARAPRYAGGANEKATWDALGAQAVQASVRLESLLGQPESDKPWPSRVAAGFAAAMEQAERDPGRQNVSRVLVWLELGADPLAPLPGKVGSALERLADSPAAWPVVAALAERGAKAGPQLAPAARQWLNCALSEGVSRPGSPPPAERVAAAKAILECVGSSMAAYRGKTGAGFDEMAIGAMWAWPDGSMGEALAREGVQWSPRSLRRAPELAAKRLSSAGGRASSGEGALACALSMLGQVEAAVGFGGFTPHWEALGKRVEGLLGGLYSGRAEAQAEWGDALGRWGRRAGWAASDWAALAKAAPTLAKAPGFQSAADAALFGEAMAPGAHQEPRGEPARPARPRL